MSEVVYEVLTEFVFDVRGAINNSEALKGAVDKVSSAADGAMFSLNRLASFAMSGLGVNLSVMGVLGSAITSFENFSKTRLQFSNIIGANMEHLSGDVGTFNDRLGVSEKVMKNIAKTAREFSLDEGSMIATTKMMAAMLVPKGLAGNNFDNAINLSRMLEKSAPILGVDTNLIQGELARMIDGQGHASMNDTLFRRLATEAPEFFNGLGGGKGGSGGGKSVAQAFNVLPVQQRFDILSKALNKFSSDADVAAGMASLLANKFMALKNELIGIDGILKPLGEVLSGPIRKGMNLLLQYLETYGRVAIVKFAGLIEKLIADPTRLFATIRQLQTARESFHKAGEAAHAFSMVMFGAWLLKFPMIRTAVMGATMALARFAGVAALVASLGAVAGGVGVTSIVGIGNIFRLAGGSVMFVLRGLGFVIGRFVLPLMAFFAAMQLFARAKGYAEVIDAKTVYDNKSKIGQFIADTTRGIAMIMRPWEYMFDAMAKAIAPLFSYSYWLGVGADNTNMIVAAIQGLAMASIYTAAVITGLFEFLKTTGPSLTYYFGTVLFNIGAVILEWGAHMGAALGEALSKAAHGDFSGAKDTLVGAAGSFQTDRSIFGAAPDSFMTGYQGVLDRNLNTLNDPTAADKNVSNHTTNINSVNIRQDFKENLEPDRIADSFVKTLHKISINPTQAAGRSYSGGLLR